MRQVPSTQNPADRPKRNRKSVLTVFAVLASGILILALSACAPAPKSQQFHEQSNTTGFKDHSGRSHTGAGDDQALERLKAELSQGGEEIGTVEKKDLELAKQVLDARIEESQNRLRVVVNLRDEGRIFFDFTDSEITSKPTATNPNVRYKSIVGVTESGVQSSFNMALLCRLVSIGPSPESAQGHQCATATISMRERHGANAKAGIILRNNDVSIVVRPVKKEKLVHHHLKRLVNDFKLTRYGRLQTFEVAWGRSGFDLEMTDQLICPSGRLVETNDLAEPLKLNCKGTETSPDLRGRMIGNTTRGELFLEVAATLPSRLRILPDTNERILILVRRKKNPKPAAPKPNGTPQMSASPTEGQTEAPPISTSSSEEEEGPEEDEEFFLDEKKSVAEPLQTGTTSPEVPGSTGWLVPVDLSDNVTKSWARDRKNPLIAEKVKVWQKSPRLEAFASHYLPNRETVISGLRASKVPAEFSFITLIESKFFVEEGYPVEISSAKAVGPWQFMPRTATDSRFGLKIKPLIRVTNENGRVTSEMADPCDERADLAKSSAAAGKYFRVLLNMFPRDPKLALAAYNWGEGNVSCLESTSKKCEARTRHHSQERLREIRELGLSFWAIYEFNMAPITTLNYVIDFVAAHHAALEMPPLKSEKAIAPWHPAPQCSP